MAVAIIAVPPDLNIDLGHLEVLSLGRDAADKQRGRHQHRRGHRYGKSNLHHWFLLLQTDNGRKWEKVSRSIDHYLTEWLNVGSEDRLHSSRARITVSGKCFGLIISLLKFFEKISEPGGHGSLKGVLCTEIPPECRLNRVQCAAPHRSLFVHRSDPKGNREQPSPNHIVQLICGTKREHAC